MILFSKRDITLKVYEKSVSIDDIGKITLTNNIKQIHRRYCVAELWVNNELLITEIRDFIDLKIHTEFFKNVSVKRRTSSGRIHKQYELENELHINNIILSIDISYDRDNTPLLRFSTCDTLGTRYNITKSLDIFDVMSLDIALHKAITALNGWFLKQ